MLRKEEEGRAIRRRAEWAKESTTVIWIRLNTGRVVALACVTIPCVNNISTTPFQLPPQGACKEKGQQHFVAATCKSLIIGRADKRLVVSAVNSLGTVCLAKLPQVAFHHIYVLWRRHCTFKEPAHEHLPIDKCLNDETCSKTRSVGGILTPYALILETVLAAGTPHIYSWTLDTDLMVRPSAEPAVWPQGALALSQALSISHSDMEAARVPSSLQKRPQQALCQHNLEQLFAIQPESSRTPRKTSSLSPSKPYTENRDDYGSVNFTELHGKKKCICVIKGGVLLGVSQRDGAAKEPSASLVVLSSNCNAQLGL
ncbi:hypothetical protein EK904_000838 [Melospiza melodia maxima]|nr:hypothetical protein EK904_000838 [Melospiza melodia maxima]